MAKKIIIKKPSVREILSQLTPFVYDEKLEAQFDKLLGRRKATIHKLRALIQKNQFSAPAVVSVIKEDPEEGLNAIISVMGLSQEEFFRHITLLRLEKAAEQAAALEEATEDFTSEWKMRKIMSEMLRDDDFAAEVVSLLFGERNEKLKDRVPRFLLNKLDTHKIRLETDALIDSLIRTGLKGRYDVKKGKPIVDMAVQILKQLGVLYLAGEIDVPHVSRKMDIVVPVMKNLLIFVECGIFSTTARELSEKGLVERQVRQDVNAHYPNAVIVRILDGVGWLARGGNGLKDVIDASDYVLRALR